MSGNSGGGNIVNETPRISALRIQTSCYGVAVPVVIGRQRCTGNMLYYGDLQAIRHEEKQSTGGGGGKGGGGGTTISNVSYTYRYSMQVGVCEGPVSVGEVWMVSGSDKLRLSQNPQYGYVINAGGTPNAYSSVLLSRHPDQFFYYPGLANFTAVDLGEFSGDSPPSFSFEVFGVGYDAAIDGADPAVAVRQIITDTRWGASAPAKWFPPVTGYGDYAVAMGWSLGLEMAQQKPAADWIQEILDQTNAAAVWAADRLTIVPFGDTAVAGNGRSWVPNVTPIYDLTDDDFIGSADTPILVTRKADSETYNIQPVEFRNQANEYNIESVEGDDPASVAMFGAKKNSSTLTAHGIRNASAAARLGKVRVQRIIRTRNGYEFTLPWTYCCLLPMDIVTLTDSWLGLDRHPVRLTNVVEQATLEIKCEAEDFPAGAGHAALVQRQGADGYSRDYNIPAGRPISPFIFEPPIGLTDQPELWIGMSGGDYWGGAEIWVSFDGDTYGKIGTITGKSRIGYLQNSLPISVDPDNSSQPVVDLSISGGKLIGVSDEDLSAFATAMLVDGEIIAYKNADLVSSDKYKLSVLRRGIYGSAIANHSPGALCARLDGALFKYKYDAQIAGKKISIKLVSFNIFYAVTETLDLIAPIEYTVVGAKVYSSISNVLIKESLVIAAGAVVPKLSVSWQQASECKFVRVRWRFGNGQWNELPDVYGESVDIVLQQSGRTEIQLTPWAIAAGETVSLLINVAGKTAAPADVSGFSINVLGKNALLNFDPSPDLDVIVGGFLWVRHSPLASGAVWGNSGDLSVSTPGSATSVTVPLLEGSYLARWVDSSGNLSKNTAALAVSAEIVGALNVIAGGDEATAWVGQKTNMAATAGHLRLVSTSAAGAYQTGIFDLGAVYQSRVAVAVQFSGFAVSSLLDNRSEMIDVWADFDGSLIETITAQVYFSATNDDPNLSPVWSAWQPLRVATDYTARAYRFELRCASADSANNIDVSSMVIAIDVPDRTETFVNVTSGVQTYHVFFEKPFFSVPAIGVSIHNSVSGDYYKIANKSLLGFDIDFYNSANVKISRTFDVTVKGY